jgi:hypothetical protein
MPSIEEQGLRSGSDQYSGTGRPAPCASCNPRPFTLYLPIPYFCKTSLTLSSGIASTFRPLPVVVVAMNIEL